jgi:hypothetical protein
MQIVLGKNIDTIKKAEATGSLITEEKYAEVGIFQLLNLQHFLVHLCPYQGVQCNILTYNSRKEYGIHV